MSCHMQGYSFSIQPTTHQTEECSKQGPLYLQSRQTVESSFPLISIKLKKKDN
uniref:Uncharacterized protein n=1 Tax=Arundo donax TaxID=35708 RepID=A0A0A9C7B9_ARUDO